MMWYKYTNENNYYEKNLETFITESSRTGWVFGIDTWNLLVELKGISATSIL